MAATMRDNNSAGPNTGDIWTDNIHKIAQTITPSVAYSLEYVRMFMTTDGGVNGTVQLFATSGGLPTGSALATVTRAVTSVATAHWETFTFDTPYEVAAGTQYAIVLTKSGTSTWTWRRSQNQDLYAGGNPLWWEGPNWRPAAYYAAHDTVFEVWGSDLVPQVPEYRVPVLQDFNWQPPVTGIQNNPPA